MWCYATKITNTPIWVFLAFFIIETRKKDLILSWSPVWHTALTEAAYGWMGVIMNKKALNLAAEVSQFLTKASHTAYAG